MGVMAKKTGNNSEGSSGRIGEEGRGIDQSDQTLF